MNKNLKLLKKRAKKVWKFINIHIIFGVIVFFIIIYRVLTQKNRKKYRFVGIDGRNFSTPHQNEEFDKSEGKHERRCREIFEKIFDTPFKKIRPDWLKNPKTGKNLELDGYSPVYKLGFEYDGIQHAEYVPYFHRNGESDWYKQYFKDNEKNKMCIKHGVVLVRIPHFIRYDDLEEYILTRLRKQKIIE